MTGDPEFDELRREFLVEAEAKVVEIGRRMSESTPPERESIERMMNLAHQLKGAGGSYGFQPISVVAAELETALEQFGLGAQDKRGEIDQRITRLREEIEQGQRSLAPAGAGSG